MSNEKNKNLLDAGNAVSSYFDTLLSEDEPQTATQLKYDGDEREAAVLLHMPNLEDDLAALDLAAEESSEADLRQSIAVTLVETGPVAAGTVAEEEEETKVGEAIDKVVPVQAAAGGDYGFPLQCLMFNVAGVNLSLPLIDMGGVLSWTENLTSLPGAPNWFLGLLKYRDRNIRVVDTAGLLRLQRDNPVESGRQILVFGESNWAVTCDHLGDVIHLNKEDVQWKTPNRKSLSLGTIRDSLTLLLNPVKILAYLDGVEMPGPE